MCPETESSGSKQNTGFVPNTHTLLPNDSNKQRPNQKKIKHSRAQVHVCNCISVCTTCFDPISGHHHHVRHFEHLEGEHKCRINVRQE
jgi:hypothetical protein